MQRLVKILCQRERDSVLDVPSVSHGVADTISVCLKAASECHICLMLSGTELSAHNTFFSAANAYKNTVHREVREGSKTDFAVARLIKQDSLIQFYTKGILGQKQRLESDTICEGLP